MKRRPPLAAPWAVVPLLAALVTAACGCRGQPPAGEETRGAVPGAARTLVLVSLDGFRADYFERLPTPHLHRLAARGARAERLVPAFPPKTYPNHFTLVTGRWPARHGIVANDIRDPATQSRFSLADRAAVRDPRWWQAEPLWTTLEKRGVPTAPMGWPGAEAAIGGVRPAFSPPFDSAVPPAERVRLLLAQLSLPVPQRPRFLTLYLEQVDDAGHAHGPDSPELAAAAAAADAVVGDLVAGIERLGLLPRTDVVVVSDHGMAATPPGQSILLDDLLPLERAHVVTWSPVLMLWPPPEEVEAVLAALRGAHPHLAVYRREELPARFHYEGNPRLPPIVALADEGWGITTRAREASRALGEHGYDPALPSMAALFIAAGASFREGVVVPPFESVAVYPLLCRALGVEPLPGDWQAGALPDVLRSR